MPILAPVSRSRAVGAISFLVSALTWRLSSLPARGFPQASGRIRKNARNTPRRASGQSRRAAVAPCCAAFSAPRPGQSCQPAGQHDRRKPQDFADLVKPGETGTSPIRQGQALFRAIFQGVVRVTNAACRACVARAAAGFRPSAPSSGWSQRLSAPAWHPASTPLKAIRTPTMSDQVEHPALPPVHWASSGSFRNSARSDATAGRKPDQGRGANEPSPA